MGRNTQLPLQAYYSQKIFRAIFMVIRADGSAWGFQEGSLRSPLSGSVGGGDVIISPQSSAQAPSGMCRQVSVYAQLVPEKRPRADSECASSGTNLRFLPYTGGTRSNTFDRDKSTSRVAASPTSFRSMPALIRGKPHDAERPGARAFQEQGHGP